MGNLGRILMHRQRRREMLTIVSPCQTDGAGIGLGERMRPGNQQAAIRREGYFRPVFTVG